MLPVFYVYVLRVTRHYLHALFLISHFKRFLSSAGNRKMKKEKKKNRRRRLMKVKLKNEKKSGRRDGGSAAEAADAWWKPIGAGAARISRRHRSPLQAVDARVLTHGKGTWVLVLSALLNEHDWFLKRFQGSIKHHAVNLIHNHETNTAIPQYTGLPCCCLNAVFFFFFSFFAHFESVFSFPGLLSALFTRHFPSGGDPGGGGVGCPCLHLTGVGLPLHCPNGVSRHSWLALVLHRAG